MTLILTICLFSYLKNLKKKGLCLGNDDESDKTNEIPYKKQNQRMAVQLMSRFFLNHKNLKETQGCYMKNDDENKEINKSL